MGWLQNFEYRVRLGINPHPLFFLGVVILRGLIPITFLLRGADPDIEPEHIGVLDPGIGEGSQVPAQLGGGGRNIVKTLLPLPALPSSFPFGVEMEPSHAL